MTETQSDIFIVKNLDCTSCAAKIENGLKKIDGVQDAVLDFASLTLHVQAKNMEQIPEEVRKIDPDVELISKSKASAIAAARRKSRRNQA